MNRTHGLRAGITVAILSILLFMSCLGAVSEDSGQALADSLPDSMSDIPSDALNATMPENLPNSIMDDELREFYSERNFNIKPVQPDSFNRCICIRRQDISW